MLANNEFRDSLILQEKQRRQRKNDREQAEQWKGIDRLSALYSIKAPFELLHADIADIRFFFKICSPSKILSSGSGPVHVENVHLHNENQPSVVSKMNLFYRDIDPLRQKINNDGRMRL